MAICVFIQTIVLRGTICWTICEDSSPLKTEDVAAFEITQLHPPSGHGSRSCLTGQQTGNTIHWPTSSHAVTFPLVLALMVFHSKINTGLADLWGFSKHWFLQGKKSTRSDFFCVGFRAMLLSVFYIYNHNISGAGCRSTQLNAFQQRSASSLKLARLIHPCSAQRKEVGLGTGCWSTGQEFPVNAFPFWLQEISTTRLWLTEKSLSVFKLAAAEDLWRCII